MEREKVYGVGAFASSQLSVGGGVHNTPHGANNGAGTTNGTNGNDATNIPERPEREGFSAPTVPAAPKHK